MRTVNVHLEIPLTLQLRSHLSQGRLGPASRAGGDKTMESLGPSSHSSDVQAEHSLLLGGAGDGEGVPLELADLRDVDDDVIPRCEVELSLQHQPRDGGLQSSGLHGHGLSVA